MVSRLINKDEANRTSEEGFVSGSDGPDISERVTMETQILRLTTAQMVLSSEALFLPDNHPLLCLINNSIAVQGHVMAQSDGPALTCLDLSIHLADDKANALVLSLMTAQAESPILEGVTGPVVLLDK